MVHSINLIKLWEKIQKKEFAIFHFENFAGKQFYKELVFLDNSISIEKPYSKPLFW